MSPSLHGCLTAGLEVMDHPIVEMIGQLQGFHFLHNLQITTMGVRMNFFRRRRIILGAKFEIDFTGTNECDENKNRTAKSINTIICLKFLRPF